MLLRQSSCKIPLPRLGFLDASLSDTNNKRPQNAMRVDNRGAHFANIDAAPSSKSGTVGHKDAADCFQTGHLVCSLTRNFQAMSIYDEG